LNPKFRNKPDMMATPPARKPIDDHLDQVYGAGTTEELSGAYADWAEDYDVDVASMGYRFPALASAMVARHVSNRDAALLDAGAGTGLVGAWLRDLGYTNLTATDFSAEMLEVAKATGAYREAQVGDLLKRLPFADDAFEGVVAVGVFTQGHVSPEGLEEVLRVVQPGGVVVIPQMEYSWTQMGFQTKSEEFAISGRWELVEQTPWAPPMPLAAEHRDDLGCVFVWRTA